MSNYYIINHPKDRDKTMIRSLIVGSTHNMEMNQRAKSPAKNQTYYQPNLLHRHTLNQNNIQNSHSNYAFKVSPSPMDMSQLDQQSRRSKPNELIKEKSRTSSELQEKIEKILLRLQKQQNKIIALQQSNKIKNNNIGGKTAEQIIEQTLNTLKKPTVMKQILTASKFNHSMNAQIYQHLFNFKMDLQSVKEQISKSMNKKQFDAQFEKINQKVHQYMEKNAQDRKKEMIDLETYFNKYFDTSFKKVEEHLKSQILSDMKQVETQLENKFNKTQPKKCFDMLNPELQLSNIKYEMPPIMIKYLQILKNQANEQMNLSEDVYYIDSQGYLLDKNSFYIINKDGAKIQLQQNHRQILKKYNVIR